MDLKHLFDQYLTALVKAHEAEAVARTFADF